MVNAVEQMEERGGLKKCPYNLSAEDIPIKYMQDAERTFAERTDRGMLCER